MAAGAERAAAASTQSAGISFTFTQTQHIDCPYSYVRSSYSGRNSPNGNNGIGSNGTHAATSTAAATMPTTMMSGSHRNGSGGNTAGSGGSNNTSRRNSSNYHYNSSSHNNSANNNNGCSGGSNNGRLVLMDNHLYTPPDRFLTRAHLVEQKRTPKSLLHGGKWDGLSQMVWDRFCGAQQTEETYKKKMYLWRYLYLCVKVGRNARE